jgi:hypothetical protein
MFVVDLMHEFELGVWRAVFVHLLRILESVSPALLIELDHRYAFSVILHIHQQPDDSEDTGKHLHSEEAQSDVFRRTPLNSKRWPRETLRTSCR